MNLTTFFTIYAKKALREKRIPFVIEADNDLFYSKSNIKVLTKSIKEAEKGEIIRTNLSELETLAGESQY